MSGSARFAWTVATVLTLVTGSSPAAELQRFSATAHDVKTDRVLFTEKYEVQVENGRWLSGTTRYALASGEPLAERRFDFANDRYVPVYSLDQTNPAYEEGVSRVEKNKVDVYQVRDGKRQTATLDRVRDVVADCGSQAYVVDHLADLEAGRTLHFTLVVAGRVDSFRLRATKTGGGDIGGVHGVRIRIELDSMLSLVLPTIELVIDPVSHRILEYTGLTSVKDPATRKSFTARMVFAY